MGKQGLELDNVISILATLPPHEFQGICLACLSKDKIERDKIRGISNQYDKAVELVEYFDSPSKGIDEFVKCIGEKFPKIEKSIRKCCTLKEINISSTSTTISSIDVAILTVIPVEFSAACESLGIMDTPETYHKDEYGRIWLLGEISSARQQKTYSFVLACIGEAGNASAASVTTDLIKTYHPQTIILMGIAAGMRGKVKIGNVVLSERVVAYEKAALRNKGIEEPRPDILKWFDSIKNDVILYMSSRQSVEQRTNSIFQETNNIFPSAVSGQEEEYEKNVAKKIEVRISTIASGEKLLRDPDKLQVIREKTHGKTETVEMEAAGFAEVCQGKKVDWLVIRGISDFGDEFKDDRFHEFASKTAATVLADFLKYGLDLAYSS